MYLKKYFIIIVFGFIFTFQNIKAQPKSIEITKPVMNPVYIIADSISGTGFIVKDSIDIFLVTAKHIAIKTSLSSKIIFSKNNTETGIALFNNIIHNKSKLNWHNHLIADISVIKLDIDSTKFFANISIPLKLLELTNDLPARESEVYVIGYPLGFGVNTPISPITKISKISSSFIQIPQSKGNGFLLDDPTVGGFSGSPVWLLGGITWSGTKNPIKIIGIVLGNVSDDTNIGGFAVITPLYYLKELLDKY